MSAARDTAGKLCGIVMLAVKPESAEAFLTELIAGFGDHDVKKHKFEVQDGYLGGTGYVLAQAMTGNPSFSLRHMRVMVLQTLNAGCHTQQCLLCTRPLSDCVPKFLAAHAIALVHSALGCLPLFETQIV